MENSKINQSELKYSCGVGNASVNLFTGRLLFEHPDISIGINSYQLQVSHIYNSEIVLPDTIKSYMGTGWKLNVQQFLFMENGKHVYVDVAGYKHIFNRLNDNQFYDTTGLGLILTVNSNNIEISDEIGNKMVFESNRLIKTICTHNSLIVKNYVYNSEGKLITIYDSRNTNNKLVLEYDNTKGLLKTIISKKNNINQMIIKYKYNSENKLLNITKTVDRITKNVALFSYLNGKFDYAISMEDKTALNFTYIGDKVTKVKTGVVNISPSPDYFAYNHNPTTYCEDNVLSEDDNFCGETERVKDINWGETEGNFYDINGVNNLGENIISQNEISYFPKKTIVVNDKNIKMVYFFNDKGFTTSILEANNGVLNDLRTLEKMTGEPMISQGSELESINGQRSHLWQTNIVITRHNIMEETITNLQKYRKDMPNCTNYTCSFWMKFNNPMPHSLVTMTVDCGGPITTFGTSSFDNSAVGSWQFITIPIKIPEDDINFILISFNGDESRYVNIADMRLCYSQTSKYCLMDGTDLDKVTKIKINRAIAPTEEVTIDITEDFYISENDLQKTYLSKFKSVNTFNLSCCDNSQVIAVNKVVLCTNIKDYPLEFGYDNYGSGSAQFFYEQKSPDNDSYTNGILHFIKNKQIGNKTIDCILQITEANKFAKGSAAHKQSHTETYFDLKGKLLMEQDEYEVQTLYDYDMDGNLSSKTIQDKDECEKLIFTVSRNNTTQTEVDFKSDVKTHFNDLYGHVNKVEYSGNNEVDPNKKLTTTFGYNTFNDNIKTVENDIGGKNYMSYACGRLYEATPIGWNSNDVYGFKICYNQLWDPCKYYLTYKNGDQKDQDLLVENNVDRLNGTITTKYHRDNEKIDTSEVTFDKYGRTASVNEDGKITTYKRKALCESSGASVLEEMYDPYEDRTYKYSYDDFNNLTEYKIINSNGTHFQTIRAKGETLTEYKGLSVPSPSEGYYESETTYHEDKLINPRIQKTDNYIKSGEYNGLSTRDKCDYKYDILGRIDIKERRVVHFTPQSGTNSFITEENTYKPNTLLKENIKTTVTNYNTDIKNTEYNLDYTYDNRGNVKTATTTKTYGSDTPSVDYIEYNYDNANRLKNEHKNGYLRGYTYNKDGSIYTDTTYTYNNDGSMETDTTTKYEYNKGRMACFYDTKSPENTNNFSYDNLGNCTKYLSADLEWFRGNLLKQYTSPLKNATYSYNNQGIRYRKEVDGKTINYILDGTKLVGESWSDGKKINYFYDIEGIKGIRVDNIFPYHYVKDAMGNVIAIINDSREVARYDYDAWGNCTIVKDIDGIGALNPIRWKSQYYDQESGLYYISGRYYSPLNKQFITALSPETVIANAGTIYGLNLYLLTIANPVNMLYNEHTIETNTALTWDPPSPNAWQRFWNHRFWKSGWGQGLAILLFVVALIVTQGSAAFCWAAGLTAASLVIGGAISGFRSKRQGKGFWNGYNDYINRNWAQSFTISMALLIVTVGINHAALAIARSKTTAPLVHNTLEVSTKDLLHTNGQTISQRSMGNLTNDIVANGIKNPVKYVEINGSKYIVNGNHRVAAARVLGMKTVPAELVKLPHQGFNTFDDVLIANSEYISNWRWR